MTDEKKTAPKGALDEDTLEDVTGGVITLTTHRLMCPCGTYIAVTRDGQRVQCPGCGRWFQVVGMRLKEETRGGSSTGGLAQQL